MYNIVMKKIGGRFKRCTSKTIFYKKSKIIIPLFKYSQVLSNFKINLNKSKMTQQYLNSEYNIWLDDAVNFIEQIITGLRFKPNEKRIINIDVSFGPLSGGILGQGGPGKIASGAGIDINDIANSLNDVDIDKINNVITTKNGSVQFSSDHYLINPTTQTSIARKKAFFQTAIHEIIHVLGYGTLWNGDFRILMNNPKIDPIPIIFPIGGTIPANITLPWALNNKTILRNAFNYMGILGPILQPIIGVNPNDYKDIITIVLNSELTGNMNRIDSLSNPENPKYTSIAALNAYKETMQGKQTATFIPIENYIDSYTMCTSITSMIDAGGTALAHWKENPGGSTLTGIIDKKGRDIADEIMTGWSNAQTVDQTWVSKFTVASLYDIGYQVDFTALELPLSKYKSV